MVSPPDKQEATGQEPHTKHPNLKQRTQKISTVFSPISDTCSSTYLKPPLTLNSWLIELGQLKNLTT